MNRTEIIELKLQPALKECGLHQMRLHAAWVEASGFEPLRKPSVEELSEEQVRTVWV